MHRMFRQSLSLTAALISATIALTGCGKPLAPPTATGASVLGSNSLVANNTAGQKATGSNLGALPVERTAPELLPDFGDSAIGSLMPGAGVTVDDPEANGAAAEGADFALTRAGIVRNQIIVQLKPGAVAQYQVSRFTAATGARVAFNIDLGNRYQVISLPSGMSVEEGLRTYGQNTGVVSATPNRIYGVAGAVVEPNDPFMDKQWGEDKIQAPEVWGQNIDASGVTVAVLDTGVDYRHPEFGSRIVKGWNFADNNADVMDRFGHGTHVAGIIGASGNNGVGVAGVAWNVKILAVKVLGDNGQGSTAAVVNGIKYAADMGAKVINMSLGSPDTTIDPALSAAIKYANGKGVIVIAAAGNNHGEVGSPANDPGAIAVSSTSKFLFWEYLSWFSNRGTKVEVAAPGGGIWSTVPLDANRTGSTGYGKLSGTSMAAPFVAGEAALIWAKHPTWTPQQVHYTIDNSVDHKGASGRNSHYGFGRINLAKALAL